MSALDDLHDLLDDLIVLPTGPRKYDAMNVALATVVANRFDGDPLWAMLVGPPSTGKTEVLNALLGLDDTVLLSSLTANTFASGLLKKGKPTSLLPKLTGKTVCMKDFTSIMTMHREKRAEIYAQLREIFDGRYTKEWGNGASFDWEGKIGLLAACTEVIDDEYSFNAQLGERFILCRISDVSNAESARRAMARQADIRPRRDAIRQAVAACLKPHDAPVRPDCPPEAITVLIAGARLVALGRAAVRFNHQGDLQFVLRPEGPARLAKQLHTLAQALACVRGEDTVTPAVLSTVVNVAWDTLPRHRQRVITVLRTLEPVLSSAETPLPTTAALAAALNLPTNTARRYLDELNAIGLATRYQPAEGERNVDRWGSSPELDELSATLTLDADAPADAAVEPVPF